MKFFYKKLGTYNNDESVLKNKLVDLKMLLEDKEKILQNLMNHLKNTNKNMNVAHKDAVQLTDNLDDSDDDFKRFKDIFQQLPDSTDDLIAKKETLLSLANLLKTPELNEMNEYERLKSALNEGNEELENARVESEELHNILQNRSHEWLTPVKEFIKCINEKFSAYFMKINCVGEVSLFTGN